VEVQHADGDAALSAQSSPSAYQPAVPAGGTWCGQWRRHTASQPPRWVDHAPGVGSRMEETGQLQETRCCYLQAQCLPLRFAEKRLLEVCAPL
jgi:hypothetical protein